MQRFVDPERRPLFPADGRKEHSGTRLIARMPNLFLSIFFEDPVNVFAARTVDESTLNQIESAPGMVRLRAGRQAELLSFLASGCLVAPCTKS